jgi:hypothetical protein
MSWVGAHLRQLRLEGQANEEVRRLGGIRLVGPSDIPWWPFGRLTPYYVIFQEADISGRKLTCLGVFPKLEGIDLRSSNLTDAELETIGRLRKLRRLYLDGTQITDAGLRHLTELKNLRTLSLECTQVTPEGVKKLQEALPECEIVY